MTAVRRVEFGEFTEEQLRVQRAGEALHRDGASPAGALELLAAITEDRTWERLTDAKGRTFNGRFRDFVQARAPFGLGYDRLAMIRFGIADIRTLWESDVRFLEQGFA